MASRGAGIFVSGTFVSKTFRNFRLQHFRNFRLQRNIRHQGNKRNIRLRNFRLRQEFSSPEEKSGNPGEQGFFEKKFKNKKKDFSGLKNMPITNMRSNFEKVESRTRIQIFDPGHCTKWSVFQNNIELIELHRMTPKLIKSDVLEPRYRPLNIEKTIGS